MGVSRKMQAEVDRLLRKVQESTEVIEIIWKKIYDTENVNRKERFEVDLKKELKKLQKYREQIRNWQSSAINNKKGLMDAQMVINKEMERLKTWERETKIKAFSREGLVQQSKMDPKEKEKSETRDWLNNRVSDLKSQIDSFETETERLPAKKGKARLPRMIHLEKSITRHKAHIRKIELILRLLDNDELSHEQVYDVMELLDDYIERNQDDFDEFNDVDEIYSSLALDKVVAIENLIRPARSKEQDKETTSRDSKLFICSSNLVARTSPLKVKFSSAPVTPVARNPSPDNTNLVARTPPRKINISSVPVTPAASNLSPGDTVSSSPINNPISTKEEDTSGFPVHKPSPSLSDTPVSGMDKSELSSCPSIDVPFPVLGSLQSTSEITKQKALGANERVGTSGMVQVLESSSSNILIFPQTAKVNEVVSSADIGNTADGAVTAGKVFSPPGMQWHPGSPFQKQNDGQSCGRTEIALDQRGKFLQQFQQMSQQGQSSLIGMASLAGVNDKQFSAQQSIPLLHQPPTSVHPQSAQQALLSAGLIDTDIGLDKVEETQQPLSDSLITDVIPSTVPSKNPMNDDDDDDDDLKASYATLDASIGVVSGSMTEPAQVHRNIDLSELGAIDDDFGGSTANSGAIHDRAYNLLMLEAAFHKIPQPGDYERESVPKHRVAVTPSSYPQKKAPLVSNPAFWEGAGDDTLFFAFYYQQNSYQQLLAARKLKKQKWRYHMENNTWFRRLEQPRVITHEYEVGAYEFFKVNGTNKEMHDDGWCKRHITNYTFEYRHMEEDPNV